MIVSVHRKRFPHKSYWSFAQAAGSKKASLAYTHIWLTSTTKNSTFPLALHSMVFDSIERGGQEGFLNTILLYKRDLSELVQLGHAHKVQSLRF